MSESILTATEQCRVFSFSWGNYLTVLFGRISWQTDNKAGSMPLFADQLDQLLRDWRIPHRDGIIEIREKDRDKMRLVVEMLNEIFRRNDPLEVREFNATWRF